MPFRNPFRDKITHFVSAAQTQKAISQRHAELDDTERSDSSTIDTHLGTKTVYCLVIFSRGKSAVLSSSCHLVRFATFSHFLCMCIHVMVATEETKTDHVSLSLSLSLSVSLSLSLSLFSFMELFLILHPTVVAVMFKCRITLNTLVEILSALHLALFLCSVWSQACTILCWIFSSEESSIKGALIIHVARFRFVPHCSETENSPLCYFAEELWISFFKFDVQFNNFFTKHDILLITYHFIVNATEQALKDELYPEYVLCLFSLLGLYLRTFYKSLFILEMASYAEPDKV